ncbi:hypothetical protein [Streptomyces sp. NPDC007355]|uniref:MGH1-like glycoside hydrolase domain-containing protein n=1 Tax=Streptomyces sp. NPDC007355 TaxID=3364778 RepID=UPI00369C71C5
MTAQEELSTRHKVDVDALRRGATEVLLRNWTGRSTVPSRALYPHQWSWDSAFIALGVRHISPLRAQYELESLLGAQWADGRIPHIAFNPDVPHGAYFPGPDFWQSSLRSSAAPATPETSGIIQPPVHALATWHTHLADPVESTRRHFLPRIYPRLVAWHHYLEKRRDLGGRGLAAIVHPWESGMDNSPSWDAPLQWIDPWPRNGFRRRDLTHAAAADRPTDTDYGRYLRLAADYRDQNYDDGRNQNGFAVEDPCFNALLIASDHALGQIADILRRDSTPHKTRAAARTTALVDSLYHSEAGMFGCRDLLHDSPLSLGSVAGLIPLIVPDLPGTIVAQLLATIVGERFRLGEVQLTPSFDLTSSSYETGRYWRGPSWFNVAWLLYQGLVQHSAPELAAVLRQDLLATALATNFAEYLDPYTGEGHGARNFSWTAATALDLLAQETQ